MFLVRQFFPRGRGAARLLVIGVAISVIASCSQVPRDPVVLSRDTVVMARGKELVEGLASCGFCHGKMREPGAPLVGGLVWHDRYGDVPAANITPDRETGIGAVPTAEVLRVLRGGWAGEDRHISLDAHRGYEWMADADLAAIVTYLRDLPPLHARVERRSVGFYERNVNGFFEDEHEVRGYVPEIPRRFVAEYGKYLVDRVARCGMCHNGASGIFSGESYLTGGQAIRTEWGERVAPSLVHSREGEGGRRRGKPFAAWSEAEALVFFRKGLRPEGPRVDSRFCPVSFYSRAAEEDLVAIAVYLRGLHVPEKE
jgi:hypothetical protein